MVLAPNYLFVKYKGLLISLYQCMSYPINCLSLLVCNEELPISDSHGLMVFKELLNFIDSFTVIMFSVEIVLKWIDNFRTFWRNPWNVFDLFVTVLVRAVSFLLPPSLYLLLSSLSCCSPLLPYLSCISSSVP